MLLPYASRAEVLHTRLRYSTGAGNSSVVRTSFFRVEVISRLRLRQLRCFSWIRRSTSSRNPTCKARRGAGFCPIDKEIWQHLGLDGCSMGIGDLPWAQVDNPLRHPTGCVGVREDLLQWSLKYHDYRMLH